MQFRTNHSVMLQAALQAVFEMSETAGSREQCLVVYYDRLGRERVNGLYSILTFFVQMLHTRGWVPSNEWRSWDSILHCGRD